MKQAQAITGHKSESSTDRYTHFDPMEFGDAVKVQAALLKGKAKKPEGADGARPALTLVRAGDGKAEGQERAS